MSPDINPRVSLLLLPGPRPDVDRSSLNSAYRQTFAELLPRLSNPQSNDVARLDVAITLLSETTRQNSRSAMFPTVQRILEQLYSLVCVVASETNTELDFPGGVDVRIFFLQPEQPRTSLDEGNIKLSLHGPLIDISTLIALGRRYHSIYGVDGEAGEALISSYTTKWRSSHRTEPSITRLPCGPTITQATISSQLQQSNTRGHRSVVGAGTFDHLHIGHKLLLTCTVFLAEPQHDADSNQPRLITIGTSGDELLKNKKHATVLESWDERQRRTAEFIESILVFDHAIASMKHVEHMDEPGPNGKNVRVKYGTTVVVDYTQISDPYGPTITDENITALVVSAETRSGGKAVNDKRAEKGWPPLQVFEIDVLNSGAEGAEKKESAGTGFESKISSTTIRKRLEERKTPSDTVRKAEGLQKL